MRRHALVLLAASFGLFSSCQPEPPAEPPSETAQAPVPAPPDSLTEQDKEALSQGQTAAAVFRSNLPTAGA